MIISNGREKLFYMLNQVRVKPVQEGSTGKALQDI
jgi:hypothetical protein